MTTRYALFLRQRYRTVLGYSGLMCVIIGAVILSPLLLLPFFPEQIPSAIGFLLPGLSLFAAGFLSWRLLTPRESPSLTEQEGSVIVVLSWAVAIAAGAAPFQILSGLNFTQAVFESTSGWTTTGLSVVDVIRAGPLILFYRSAIQLAGGAGLAIIMLSAIAGVAGSGLSSAEGRTNQLLPHVRRSARLVVIIYAGYAIVGIFGLKTAGMNWFDAVNNAFAAVSTGGFATRPESIGYWNSAFVEAVIIALMILGNLNFVTAYVLLQGKFHLFFKNGEVRVMTVVLPLSVAILMMGVTGGLYPSLGKSLRVAVFEAVSALTTTGFSTVGYGNWNSLGWLILIVLMLIGGGSCSTAGGIKQYRIYVLYRSLLWEFKRMALPKNAVTEPDVWQGDEQCFLSDQSIRQVGVFLFLYMATFFAGTAVLSANGNSIASSMFEFASSLSTVGLSLGITAPGAPSAVLWTETAGMILGRLEFFVIFIGAAKLVSDGRELTRMR